MGIFKSFFMAGFECSTHRTPTRRLDLIKSTQHDRYLEKDYARLKAHSIATVREGLRWHIIEPSPGEYDFSSSDQVAQAAKAAGLQVIWDLLHFGWPDFYDIYSPDFIEAYVRFVTAFAERYKDISYPLWVVPVNEISFVAWAGGDMAIMKPFSKERGDELKRQLVRISLAGADAVREIEPAARIAHVEPAIHIVPNSEKPERTVGIAGYNMSQYQAWDMVCGRQNPELGGHFGYLDFMGINYYARNQWVDHGQPLSLRDRRCKPFRFILEEIFERYQRPIFISETGTEDEDRGPWLEYVCNEILAAFDLGVPVCGVCLYPILNHPGWVDDRYCRNGMWDYADENGERELHVPLAKVISRFSFILEEGAERMQKAFFRPSRDTEMPLPDSEKPLERGDIPLQGGRHEGQVPGHRRRSNRTGGGIPAETGGDWRLPSPGTGQQRGGTGYEREG